MNTTDLALTIVGMVMLGGWLISMVAIMLASVMRSVDDDRNGVAMRVV